MTETTPIPGFSLIPNFITEEQEQTLITKLNESSWNTDLPRRVQHYGYRYDYRQRTSDNDNYLGPLPDWSTDLCTRVTETGQFTKTPEQIIINEYLTTQGIGWHIDAAAFGPVIATLSLLETWEMEFSRVYKPNRPEHMIALPARSLAIITGLARYKYYHQIPRRIEEPIFDDAGHLTGFRRRQHRISVTFRTMQKD